MQPYHSVIESSQSKTAAPPRTRSRRSTRQVSAIDGTIILTGRRRDDHFTIYVGGKRVDLAHSAVKTLIDLVLARAKSGTGLIPISRMSIYRLRQAINRYVGRGIGKLLIETGCREEYRLGIPPDQIAVRVGVTSCFFELLGTQAISKVQAEGMRSVCRSCELEETEALLNGD